MKLGVITDIQYADADPPDFAKHRIYRLSLKKLAEAIEFFNTQELDCIVNLGDTIDWGIENYKPVVEILNKSKHKIYHALGNHDFYTVSPPNDDRIELKTVLDILNMPNNYYTVDIDNFRLIFIDNNEVGVIEHPKGSKLYEQGLQVIEESRAKNLVNAQDWNGTISDTQLDWIKQQIKDAKIKGKKVLMFAHAQVYPEHRETMLRNELILDLIDENRNVIAFMNGHNHDGDYGVYNGVPCVTFKGMLDTDENSYAVVSITNEKLDIIGYGREVSRIVTFK